MGPVEGLVGDPTVAGYTDMFKALVKRWPEVNPELEKVSGYDEFFGKHASHIAATLGAAFDALVDAAEWVTAVERVLVNGLGSTPVILDPTGPLDVTRLALSLLARFIKVHLFIFDWGKDPLRKLAAAMYKLRATDTQLRVSEDVWGMLTSKHSGLLGDFIENGVAELVPRLEGLHTVLTPAMDKLFMTMAKSRNTAALRKEGIFSLVLKPEDIASPASHSALLAALRHTDLVEWPMFALIACPKCLDESESASAMLKALLTDNFVVPIFRDAVFYPHKVFEEVLSAYASKASSKTVRKLSKQVSDWAKDAPAAFTRRADARTFLRHELGTLHTLVQDKPGLTAPKAPLILAACAMASSELLWLYTHIDRPAPPAHKRYEPEKQRDGRAIELIFLVEQLWAMAMKNERLICSYYLEYLSKAGVKVADGLAGMMRNQAAVHDVQEMRSLIAEAGSAGAVDALSVRRLWASAQVHAACDPNSAAVFLTPNTQTEIDKMHFVALHSLLATGVDAAFSEYIHTRQLWYFRSSLLRATERAMSDGPVQPKAISSVVRLLASVTENATIYWAAERELLGNAAVAAATRILNNTCKRVCILIHEVAISRMELGHAVTDRNALVDAVRAKVKSVEVASSTKPGEESVQGAKGHEALEKLRLRERNLWQLLESLSDFATVVIYNSSLCPAEFLRSKITKQFQSFIRTSVGEPSPQDGLLERPSVVEQRVLAYADVMMLVEGHMDVDIGAIIRSVWLGEVYEEGIGFAGQQLHLSEVMPENAAKSPRSVLPRATSRHDQVRPGLYDTKACVGEQLAAWFSAFVATKTRKDAAVYSPLRRGFAVRGHDSSTLGETLRGGRTPVEDWVDLAELTSLCRLIGPYGVKQIERPLMETLLGRVKSMRDILSVNKAVLEQFTKKFFSPSAVESLLKKSKDLDAFMGHAAVVGNILFLRELLRDAMARALDEELPGVHRTLRDATANYEPNFFRVPALINMDALASDAGVRVPGGVDPGLSVLSRYSDPASWQYLPYMFAMCMHAKWWNDATYNSALDAFLNHTSAVAKCLNDLVVVYAVMDPDRKGEPRAIRRSLDAFVESAAVQVLAAGHTHKNGRGPVLIFLDQFVDNCPHLTRESLERAVPYSLIRNAYTAAYTGAKVKGKLTDTY